MIKPQAIGELLRAISDYQGYFVTKCALRLAPLVFVRPGELRKAEWTEFNFEASEWRIPAEKMKMRVTHIVPLSTQAIFILRRVTAINE
ncbi:tyrosine-type recombinase/integrase [Rickettsiella massiliensis]|uniref:tyrosine-type recombinase/integrase n=1 Tax=Rickettsiella massiliensis TaxID=676517 RepID=UPI002E22EC3E|nr:tyrosine-type recombinase/integrase [Rickettsiella massiliensis]